MNLAIVDDEEREIGRLVDVIRSYIEESGVELSIDTFHSAEEILAVFHPYAYTAIFMDIYMEGRDGVDAAGEILDIDPSAKIIFLTSSDERMPDAFSIHAYDYIAKPAQKERIFRVMDDVMMRETKLSEVSRFHFISNRAEVSLPYPDIMLVRTNGRKQEIVDRNETIYETSTLFTDISRELMQDNRFLLLLRGILVNMDYVARIRDEICELKNGQTLQVNVKRSAEIAETWQNYKLESIRAEQKRKHRRQRRERQ